MNLKELKFQTHYAKTASLLQCMKQLHRQCGDFDRISQRMFYDEEYQDYSDRPFAYTAVAEHQTVGFLCPYIIDRYNVEFCIFVLPQYRRSQIGAKLFFQMVHDFGQQSFCASLNPDNKTGKAFLTYLGFSYGCQECHMVLEKADFAPAAPKIQLSVQKENEQISITGLIDEINVGSLKLTAFDMTVCIHDMEIRENLRRKGYGFQLLTSALTDIFEKYDRVILHVTKENLPAFRLYLKTGFQVLEKLDYYEL